MASSSKHPFRVMTCVWAVVLFFLVGIICAEAEEEKLQNLDGVYTESRAYLGEDGKETVFLPHDYAVLEFHGEQFHYWHFSDRIGSRAYPISGGFERKGALVELKSDQLLETEKRWLAMKVKGVEGIWPEHEWKAWNEGKYPTHVPILVKVAKGPMGKNGLNQDEFKYPSVTPLLNLAAAVQYWEEEQGKHEVRYNEVPEPLRTLLRARTDQEDGDMLGYRELILIQQKQPDALLVEQLVSEIRKGVSIVVGPMVLEDIYGLNILWPDKPAFEKKREDKLQALTTLVDAMSAAKDERALTAMLMVFVRTSGVEAMDLQCADGQRVKLSWKGNRKSYDTYRFDESVRKQCQEWAREQLAEMFEQAK